MAIDHVLEDAVVHDEAQLGGDFSIPARVMGEAAAESFDTARPVFITGALKVNPDWERRTHITNINNKTTQTSQRQ